MKLCTVYHNPHVCVAGLGGSDKLNCYDDATTTAPVPHSESKIDTESRPLTQSHQQQKVKVSGSILWMDGSLSNCLSDHVVV